MRIETVSVIVPTRSRSAKLATCLKAIARQRLPEGVALDVIVVFDGDEAAAATLDVGQIDRRIRTQVIPASGAAAARNAGIEMARGELLLFLNDDCYPDDDWLIGHLQVQRALPAGGMCVGRTEWARWDDETVFDAMVRETSMVFFEGDMVDGADYGFRHFWTCNTSVPTTAVRAVGGFDERLRPVFFEDIELGYRLHHSGVPGVRYVAGARCTHDHRLTWSDYLKREISLGRMAVRLAEVNPACFEAIFGYESALAMASDCRAWLRLNERDAANAARLLSTQMLQCRRDMPEWETRRDLLYFAHLPVKRAAFRRAFIEASSKLIGPDISQAGAAANDLIEAS